MPDNLGHPDRNFSRNFFIANWEIKILCTKRVSVEGSNPPNIEIHPSPSCICPGPISGRGRIFEKNSLWGPKIDFSQNGQMCSEDSKTLSRCSLGLVWPPPSVVSIYMTLGEIWIFGNFGRFWPYSGNPQVWPWPPPFLPGTTLLYEKSNQSSSDHHNHGGAPKVCARQGFTTYNVASWMVQRKIDFWYRVISLWPNLVRNQA